MSFLNQFIPQQTGYSPLQAQQAGIQGMAPVFPQVMNGGNNVANMPMSALEAAHSQQQQPAQSSTSGLAGLLGNANFMKLLGGAGGGASGTAPSIGAGLAGDGTAGVQDYSSAIGPLMNGGNMGASVPSAWGWLGSLFA